MVAHHCGLSIRARDTRYSRQNLGVAAGDYVAEVHAIETLINQALGVSSFKFDAVHGEYQFLGDQFFDAAASPPSGGTLLQQYLINGYHVNGTVKPSGGGDPTHWSQVANGAQDALIDAFISQISSLLLSPVWNPQGKSIRMSFNHEMYGTGQTDSTSAATYVAGQRHFVDYLIAHMSAAAWARFRILWWPTAATFHVNLSDVATIAATAFYPGDAYVDFVGGDGYPRFPSNNDTPTGHGGVYSDFEETNQDPKYTRGNNQSVFHGVHAWTRTHTLASTGPYTRKTGQLLPEQPDGVTCKPIIHGEYGIQSLTVPPPIWPGKAADTTVTTDGGSTLTLANAGVLGSNGEVAILQGSKLEVVRFIIKGGNTISGLTRGIWGTTQQAFTSGAQVFVPTVLLGRAKLAGPMTAGQLTIPCDVLQLTGGQMFAKSGPYRVKLEGEVIIVDFDSTASNAVSGNTLINCQRGADGTVALPHTPSPGNPITVELVEDKGDGTGTKGMAATWVAMQTAALEQNVPEVVEISTFSSTRGAGPDESQQWPDYARLSIYEGPPLGSLLGGGEWVPDNDRLRAKAIQASRAYFGGSGGPPPPPPPPPAGVHPLTVADALLLMAGVAPDIILPPPPPPPPPPGTTALSEIPESSCDHYATFWSSANANTLQSGRSGGVFGDMVKCGGKYWVGGYMDTVVAKNRTSTYTRYGLYWMDATTLDIDPSFDAQLTPTGFGGGRVWDLDTDGVRVVAVGAFTASRGQARNHVAVYNADGSLSSLLAGWLFNGDVHAVVIDGTDLYLAGDFTTVTPSGGAAQTRNRLCKITTWSSAPALDSTWRPEIPANSNTYQLHKIVDAGNSRILITVQAAQTINGVSCEGQAVGTTNGTTPYWYFNTGKTISSVTPDDRVQKVVVGVRGGSVGPGDSAGVINYGGSAGLVSLAHFFQTDGDVQMTGTYKLTGEPNPMLIAGGHGQFAAAAPDTTGTSISCFGCLALNASDFTLRDDFRPFFQQNGATLPDGGGVLKTWGSYADEAAGLFFVLGDFTKVQTHDGTVTVKPQRRIAAFREVSG